MSLAYPSRPLTQLQPDRFAVQARLRGLDPAPPSKARVLEIGCSDAGNLAALAAYAPHAEFVGIDLDADAVAAAPRMPNLRVLQADLNDFDGGHFDYVIAHGVYSWIPRPAAVIECVARHLEPNGVGCISYDCLPGAYLRVMAGEVLRREAGGDIARARSVMRTIAESTVQTDRAQVMRLAMSYAQAKPDYVLAHDELQAQHHPVYFDEFVRQAGESNLYYVGEAHVADGAGEASDRIGSEQWSDYATGRPFRQSLLSTSPAGALSPDLDLYVSAPVRRVKNRYRLLGSTEVETDDVALMQDLDLMARSWPGAVPWRELTSDPGRVVQLYAARAIDLRSEPVHAVRPGARPYVVPAMRGVEFPTTVRHEPLHLDAASSRVVALMDGRHTRDDIAATEGVSRADLDALIQQLGQAGLFLTPPAVSAY